MADYGIKVSRPGFDVKAATPEQLSFSSKYGTLKVYDRNSGTITHANRTITIPHNLGYVPLFLVHVDPGLLGQFYLTPYGNTSEILIYAYADSTNLYIKASNSYGINTYTLGSSIDESMARDIHGIGTFTGGWAVGRAAGGNEWDGAVRFSNIQLVTFQTVVSATLYLYIATREGTGQVDCNIYGIDEDNTAVFNSGTFPTARTKTSATAHSTSGASLGDFLVLNVKDMLTEIVNRSGWASNNAMGFMMIEDSSANGNGYSQIGSSANTKLEIIPNSNLASYRYTIFHNQLNE